MFNEQKIISPKNSIKDIDKINYFDSYAKPEKAYERDDQYVDGYRVEDSSENNRYRMANPDENFPQR